MGSRELDPSPDLQTWIFLTNYLFSSRLHSSAGPWETYWLQLSENPPLKEQQEAQSAHKLTQDLCWVPDRQLCQKKPLKKKKKGINKITNFFPIYKITWMLLCKIKRLSAWPGSSIYFQTGRAEVYRQLRASFLTLGHLGACTGPKSRSGKARFMEKCTSSLNFVIDAVSVLLFHAAWTIYMHVSIFLLIYWYLHIYSIYKNKL